MALFFECGDPDVRADAIRTAASSVSDGQLVVLPTDTVYGLGVDAFDDAAVAELLRVKGRGRDMPVPVLVGSWSTIDGLVSVVETRARDLIEAFWPGGLTLVVRYAPSLTWDLGDSRGTVAVRMPLHPVAIELLEQTGPMRCCCTFGARWKSFTASASTVSCSSAPARAAMRGLIQTTMLPCS